MAQVRSDSQAGTITWPNGARVASGASRARLPFGYGARFGLDRSLQDRLTRARYERIYGQRAADALAKKMDRI